MGHGLNLVRSPLRRASHCRVAIRRTGMALFLLAR